MIFVENFGRAPVLFRQRRIGYWGEEFELLKFRSMRIDAEDDGNARWSLPNDNRITKVGKIIRRFRIDELPQLLNIIRGEMSFVGPRPERPEFVAELATTIPYYRERHSVKPGLSGWAQVCFPYGSSIEDARKKLEYDLYYVKNHSCLFDLVILLQTLDIVVWGRGNSMPDRRSTRAPSAAPFVRG
jgi:lipopolysaccharide/colanic/teichoic acid biosynthesis glycosyltransferase